MLKKTEEEEGDDDDEEEEEEEEEEEKKPCSWASLVCYLVLLGFSWIILGSMGLYSSALS